MSISVDTYTTVTFNSESLQISNKLDSILETKYDENNLIDTKEEMEAQ